MLAVALAGGTILRVWNVRSPISLDETVTGTAGRLPFTRMITFLRDHDAHPPLDYLLRAPISRHTQSVWALRAPSLFFSVATLVIFSVWARRFGLAGRVAAVFMAIDWLLLSFAWSARMYPDMALIGVLIAVTTERWLSSRATRHAVATAALVLIGLFLHAETLILIAGLMCAAGLSRRRSAWVWRGVLVAATMVWGAVWGPVFVHQLGPSNGAGYIPYTDLDLFLRVISNLVDTSMYLELPVVMALACGGVILYRRDRNAGVLWLSAFGIPAVLAGVIGSQRHFFVAKSLAFGAWAPLLALGIVVDWARRRERVHGIAAAMLVAVVMAPSAARVMLRPAPALALGPAVAIVKGRAHAGDAVAADPGYLIAPVQWLLTGVKPPRPIDVPSLEVSAFILDSQRWDGTVWLIDGLKEDGRVDPGGAGLERCGTSPAPHDYEVGCLRRPNVP